MTLLRKTKAAAIVGSALEFILLVPLFLLSIWPSHAVEAIPAPLWLTMLEWLQKPGGPATEYLLRIYGPRYLAHRISPYLVTCAAWVLVLLIQTVMFSLVALAVVYFLDSRKAGYSVTGKANSGLGSLEKT